MHRLCRMLTDANHKTALSQTSRKKTRQLLWKPTRPPTLKWMLFDSRSVPYSLVKHTGVTWFIPLSHMVAMCLLVPRGWVQGPFRLALQWPSLPLYKVLDTLHPILSQRFPLFTFPTPDHHNQLETLSYTPALLPPLPSSVLVLQTVLARRALQLALVVSTWFPSPALHTASLLLPSSVTDIH